MVDFFCLNTFARRNIETLDFTVLFFDHLFVFISQFCRSFVLLKLVTVLQTTQTHILILFAEMCDSEQHTANSIST